MIHPSTLLLWKVTVAKVKRLPLAKPRRDSARVASYVICALRILQRTSFHAGSGKQIFRGDAYILEGICYTSVASLESISYGGGGSFGVKGGDV